MKKHRVARLVLLSWVVAAWGMINPCAAQEVNVTSRPFGAKGDGRTNDLEAFKAAIAAAADKPHCFARRVRVPIGIYKLYTDNVPKSYEDLIIDRTVELIGDGPGFAGGGGSELQFAPGCGIINTAYCAIRDLRINGEPVPGLLKPASVWQRLTPYKVGDVVRPKDDNRYYFECIGGLGLQKKEWKSGDEQPKKWGEVHVPSYTTLWKADEKYTTGPFGSVVRRENDFDRIFECITPGTSARASNPPQWELKPNGETSDGSVRWKTRYTRTPDWYELLTPSVNDVGDIRPAGNGLVIGALVQNVLHIRIFDGDGNRVVDTDEDQPPFKEDPNKPNNPKRKEMLDFKSLLRDLGVQPSQDKKEKVISAALSIVDAYNPSYLTRDGKKGEEVVWETKVHAGVHMRADCEVSNCFIFNFSNAGIHIQCDTGYVPPRNCNTWHLSRDRVQFCGLGVAIAGGDSNAGYSEGLSIIHAGETWTHRLTAEGNDAGRGIIPGTGGVGIYDRSFLGCTHVGAHVEATTGAAYIADAENTRSVFLGCYAETAKETPNRVKKPSIVLGGIHVNGFTADSDGPRFSNDNMNLLIVDRRIVTTRDANAIVLHSFALEDKATTQVDVTVTAFQDGPGSPDGATFVLRGAWFRVGGTIIAVKPPTQMDRNPPLPDRTRPPTRPPIPSDKWDAKLQLDWPTVHLYVKGDGNEVKWESVYNPNLNFNLNLVPRFPPN